MTINELKAHAYDCIRQMEFWQIELKKTNEAIAQEEQKPKEPEAEPKKD